MSTWESLKHDLSQVHRTPVPETLPLHPHLTPLSPWQALRRGATITLANSTSLLLSLLAEPSTQGAWIAAIALPSLGIAAAQEAGINLDHLALIPNPGPDIATATAALLDGFDIVAINADLPDSIARKLSARARNRGAILISLTPWPGAELELTRTRARWTGLGQGHGHLETQRAEVHARGRGAASRPVRHPVTLQPLTRSSVEHMFEQGAVSHRGDHGGGRHDQVARPLLP
ncbi:hypothetical protein [Actinokineospora enzanensis]|uniref:hypothetical protein n=1 Tax=Actinokineospora enzanensis TaxID=155975 RepID=UPI0003A025D3|nr:hypothetical protein [Actinokineospora enzanensis]